MIDIEFYESWIKHLYGKHEKKQQQQKHIFYKRIEYIIINYNGNK